MPQHAQPATPSTPNANPRSGVLVIRVVSARGLVSPGQPVPAAIQQELMARMSGQGGAGAGAAAGGAGSGVHRNMRESLQRKQMWWLPYIVLEFDKNEVLVDALGGELDSPVWHYRARLCVAASVRDLSLLTLFAPATSRGQAKSPSRPTCAQPRPCQDRSEPTWATTSSWQE